MSAADPVANNCAASAIAELEAIDDRDARKVRARELVPSGPLGESNVQEWRVALKRVAGLGVGDFDKLRTEKVKAQKRSHLSAVTVATVESCRMLPIPTSRISDTAEAVIDPTTGHCIGIMVKDALLPVPHLHGIYVTRDGNNDVRSRYYLLSRDPESSNLAAFSGDDLARGRYIDKLGMAIPDDAAMQSLIVTYLRIRGAAMPIQEGTARWIDGSLALPPRQLLPEGYLRTMGTEASARALWAQIAAIACQPDGGNTALTIGAAYAAPFVSTLHPTKPPAAAWLGAGEPRMGKSTNVSTAAYMYGDARTVNPPISESTISIGESLAVLGVLPFFRDEAHSAGFTDAQWKSLFMRLLNGASRRRAGRDGGASGSGTSQWWGYWFISGNVDVRFGAVDGVRARVVVTNDPHTPSEAASDLLAELASQCYGWPIAWFVKEAMPPADFKALSKATRDTLEGRFSSGTNATVAAHLSTAIAGAALFGKLVGVPQLRDAAVLAALRVLETLEGTQFDMPVTFAAQLLHDVWSDANANPGAYVSKEIYGKMLSTDSMSNGYGDDVRYTDRDVRGIHDRDAHGEYLAVLRTALDGLVAGKDYDKDAALSALKQSGVLSCAAGRKTKQIRIGPRLMWFYVFRAVDDPDLTDTSPPDAPIPAILEPTASVAAVAQVNVSAPTVAADSAVAALATLLGTTAPNDEAERLRAAVEDDGECASDEDVAGALAMWHHYTGSQRFDSYPGHIGVAFYSRLVAQHRNMIEPARLGESAGMIAEVSNSIRKFNDHLVPNVDTGAWNTITGMDVRAQYLAAGASVDLGDGEPIEIIRPQSLRPLISRPGYLEIASAIDTNTGAFGIIEAGEWLANPTAKYLIGRGVALNVSRAIVWETHGRRLASWCAPFSKAYCALAQRTDIPAVYARRAIKKVYQPFLGGMIRSEKHNSTGTSRLDWSDMLVTTAGANMLRGLDKEAMAGGSTPVGIHRDTAYFATNGEAYSPSALELKCQPGKWRTDKIVAMNEDIRDGYNSSRLYPFRDAVNDAAKDGKL